MNKLLRLFASRINNKLMLLSVIPVAVVTLVITLHTIDARRTELNQFQVKTAVQLAKNLATISDFALYSGRKDILGPLAASAKEIPAITAIIFLNPERKPFMETALPNSLSAGMLARGDYTGIDQQLFVIEEPVYLVDVTPLAGDDEGETTASPTLLGWVVVVADNTQSEAQARDIIVTHLLISFAVLLGAVLLSYTLSNNVVSPIRAMTAAVRDLERGNLNVRILPTTGDELAILANGINHLAKTVAEGRENLENKVEQATQQLTVTLIDLTRKNRELEIARRDAEAASAAKGDFLAQMSHELRTPITAILGFVKLLGASDLKPSEVRYCTIIQQASEQLLQLIDDILDITRLQSNVISLENTPLNLAECIEGPISLMAPTAHEKGLELILDVGPTVPYSLLGDSLRIRQIIYNLLSNAIKFTPAGYVLLRVRANNLEDKKAGLLIQVTDTGIGIPEKQQAGLFESFSQADSSISRRFGGSGLGLAIVKRLVEMMDGDIKLASGAGKGTTFTISLPLTLQPAQDNAPPMPRQHCALLLDSHPQSRQALENRLGRYVDVVDSCESFADLEISDPVTQPDIIVYSPQLSLPVATIIAEVTRLRQRFPCPIAVFTPATATYKSLPSHLLDNFQPIHFLDKPPMSAELTKLFSNPQEQVSSAIGADNKGLDASILVAEDNEFTRILLQAFFDDSGCELTMVSNGAMAVQVCQDRRFDLVLMDVHMPEVNGIEALRTIRGGDGPNRNTPVVMLTADILQQEENALFDMGASDLVFKPFDDNKLLAVIRKHLHADVITGSHSGSADASKELRQKKMFSDEVIRLAEEARSALARGDGEGLRDAIHQLLGIAGVYHMTYLERAVQALHLAIKEKNGNKIVAAMETLTLELEKLAQ